ncbi:hypothetical protein CRENBAI_015954 [Crenichthys baileyi]|uniref:Coiled-coil domain-containing protein 176 n=1 Tax=Crenichthys baileyi TaxID=28760 RepID=A0AAV9SBG2_9TELE
MATKTTKQGRGRKTKNDVKPQSKQEKKQNAKMAEVSSDLWELKLKRTEQDLAHYKKAHHNMVSENEQLRSFLYHSEMSNFQTTDYWQKQLNDRDKKIENLKQQLKREEELAIKAKLEWENERKQYFEMFEEDILKRKANEAVMQKKIVNMRKQMHTSKEEYRENLREKEKEKYSLIEKQRAEIERQHKSNETKRILVKLDHEKAIAKLESELKQTYKEKNCLSEKLQNAVAEVEDLKNLARSLRKDKLALAVDKKILTSTLKENIAEMALEKKTLAEVKAKAASLERALKKMEEEMGEKEKRNQVTIQASEVELDKLQKIIAMREKEIHHIKQLARTIVEKRKDMEVFFREALDHIRQEIADDRKRYKREAYQDYRQKFRNDTVRRTRLPPIRTFHQSPNSTNSVYSDMKAVDKEVYISDLTWEQKEKVLTLLFAKMNGNAESEVN